MKIWKSRKNVSHNSLRLAAIVLPAMAVILVGGSAAQANYGGGADTSCGNGGDGQCTTPPIPTNSYYNCINWRASSWYTNPLGWSSKVSYQVVDTETQVIVAWGAWTANLLGTTEREGTIHGLYGSHYVITVLGNSTQASGYLNNNCT